MNEYLKKLLKALAEKNQAMQTALSKSAAAGTTPDEETEQEIQALEKDIAAIEINIERTKKQIAATEAAAKNATPVAGDNPEEAANSAKGVHQPKTPKVEVKPNLEKGIGLAMLVRAKLVSTNLAKTQGEYVSASDILKSWDAPEHVQRVAKAVVGTTTSPEYSALVDTQNLVGEFIDLLRPRTIIDQLQGFRRVPFNVTIPTKTSGSIVNWVGEAKRKPVTNLAFGKTNLGFAKIAGIVPFSDELSRFSNPNVDRMVRDDLSDTIVEFMNDQFIDPAKGETVDSPASILNGVTPIVASGITAEQIKSDLRKLRTQFITANLSLSGAYYVMSETMASFISDLTDALGNPVFKGMDAPVGSKTIKGLPVVESEMAGKLIALIKPSEILLADDGGIDLSVSNEATLVYNNGTADVTVNLWQENLIAIRAERYVRWKPRRAQAAGYIDYSAQTIE
ncbi:phage major capsid protein [Acinetobacter nosocomialis]|uniref:phage major capsid protein n=1 Tax=Acinetobacter TaxID=469 RepID=UPI0008DCEED9|nr:MULTISPECIES: phage major capsid protein [Acinetobacter]MDN8174069.1 phage major capsid protein [Acinetobacter baumannii]EHU1208303.1 phage major capsid protein [Acinetobacter nosocomialis]MDF0636041.1 phage major capsid protein [Acinetobacter nosocomialis]MDQ8860859.1 phage major capsid protein [Acinetobacter nosocomialis]MDQ8875188.1 phage major capsid protein [Acinetobacter nosocomialis]